MFALVHDLFLTPSFFFRSAVSVPIVIYVSANYESGDENQSVGFHLLILIQLAQIIKYLSKDCALQEHVMSQST